MKTKFYHRNIYKNILKQIFSMILLFPTNTETAATHLKVWTVKLKHHKRSTQKSLVPYNKT